MSSTLVDESTFNISFENLFINKFSHRKIDNYKQIYVIKGRANYSNHYVYKNSDDDKEPKEVINISRKIKWKMTDSKTIQFI